MAINSHGEVEKYWNMCGFLSDEEVHTIWNIIDNALDRHGWVGCADDGELSIRIFDDNLKQSSNLSVVKHFYCQSDTFRSWKL